MEQLDDRFHSRVNPRLRRYDYAQPGYYFVTICTHEKKCFFGMPGSLNRRGRCAEAGLREIGTHFPGVSVDQYVVMPNHVHAILVLPGGGAKLPVVIGQFKSAVTRMVREFDPGRALWQTSFHDHVIRNQADYQRIWSYIEANPMRWMDDCFYVEQSP